MKKLVLLISLITIISCNKTQEKELLLTCNIKGFKKGTVYIQRVKDTSLVAIDTIKVNGNSEFTSEIDLKEPEMLFLFLDRGVTNSIDNNIPFFAEKGKINIETTIDHFTYDAKITGSKNQELYDEYKKVTSRFVDQNLELIEKKLTLYKNKSTEGLKEIEEKQNSILKKRYLYTTNFAVNHADYEIAPYITLAEIPDINLKYLDTIDKSMTEKVAKSLYGKKLKELLSERKKVEK